MITPQLGSTSTVASPPLTRPLNLPPPLCRSVHSSTAPLYGLGWRCSFADIFRRHPATCTASVVERVMPLWAQIKKRDKIGSKIIFDPCFVNYSDSELSDGDNRDMVCFITFNTHAKSLEGLLTSEGHLTKDGREFVKAAQTVLKFDLEQEGDTFMWYRCSPM
ncbi:hypothetical protein GGX14DRAFT_569318 [Mycena pura]|uniref:Uncharacterized protein n=1 Tax=Mycena pura TaxID=153505 RepID=A0AAD6VB59_9AGAR|nr:hypothetical protein GGX14DRAFT_569318 [Mycena pura]